MNRMGMLTRKYMLDKLNERRDVLIKEYKGYINGKNPKGEELSYSSAAFHRSKTKKDICLLTLVEELLYNTPQDMYIEHDDSVDAFMRLIKE